MKFNRDTGAELDGFAIVVLNDTGAELTGDTEVNGEDVGGYEGLLVVGEFEEGLFVGSSLEAIGLEVGIRVGDDVDGAVLGN